MRFGARRVIADEGMPLRCLPNFLSARFEDRLWNVSTFCSREIFQGECDARSLLERGGGGAASASRESCQDLLSIEHDVDSCDCLDLRQTPKQPHRLDRIHTLPPNRD